jgi:hypothetical protein
LQNPLARERLENDEQTVNAALKAGADAQRQKMERALPKKAYESLEREVGGTMDPRNKSAVR